MPDVARSTVLAIFAHPDDESLACGGTLARLSDAGVRVVLMCGSRGESGSVSDPALLADGDLAAVRTRELREAAAILGISEVIVMDHPDGDLRWDKVSEFHDDIVEAIRAAAPPLYYVTMPSGVMREVVEAAHAKGGAPPDSSFWGINPDAFGDSATPPTFSIDVRDWAPRKLAALRCHRTQMGQNNPIAWIDENEARQWLGVEYFRRSSLDASTSGSVLEQLGEPAAHS